MSTALGRRFTHPLVPASVMLVASGWVLAAAPIFQPVVAALAWALLGVSAGYSISGSV